MTISLEFEQCLKKIIYPQKIFKRDFLKEGIYPVVSQEQGTINGYYNDSKNLFTINKPIIVFGDHTRIIKFIDFDFIIGADGVKILDTIDKINPKYLFYYLLAYPVNDLGYSRHYKLLKELQIPVPPLPEQKRIVGVLDLALADIDGAVQITEDNLQNIKDLWQSALQQKLNNPYWEMEKLESICKNLDGKRIPITKNKRVTGEIPYYGASGIVDYVKDYIFDESILLVSEDGANLLARATPIAFSVSGKCWVNNHAHVLTFANQWLQRWVEYYLNSISLESFVTGAAQPKLSQSKLNTIPIPVPPIDEQQKIISELDAIGQKLQSLETLYQQKLTHLNDLKQSILQQAFQGKL